MRQIAFSAVGVPVKSMEEVEEIYMTYSALGISFVAVFDRQCTEAKRKGLEGYFIQGISGTIETKVKTPESVSLIKYPIKYSMDSLDFAVACHLINTDQEDELIAHLDKYCKEYK